MIIKEKMPVIRCPLCEWKSDDLDAALAAVLAQQLAMHDKAAHSNTTPNPTPQKLNIDPPKIGVGATPEEWEAFGRQWAMYKTGAVIAASQAPTALFYCCSEELRLDIMRDIRLDVATMPEPELLNEIKRLAVKDESILVHRMRLGKMVQTPGMGIRTFLANLRGQAALCKFTVQCSEEGCTHTFDYSKEIIKDNLVRGISDPDILADLLGDVKTDRTLGEIVSFIATKRAGKSNEKRSRRQCRGDPSSKQPPGNLRKATIKPEPQMLGLWRAKPWSEE